MSYKHDICIVGQKCYGLLVGFETPKYLGGIERVLVALARGMASQGVRVAFLTYDEGQESCEVVDGITVIRTYQEDAGIRGLRFLHPRTSSFWRAMAKADAPVYLQMGAGVETFWTSLFTRYAPGRARSFVYCLASDSDAMPDVPLIGSDLETNIYIRGLKAADMIIAQTKKQQQLLLDNFSIASQVSPLPYITSASSDAPLTRGSQVLWVGRPVKEKRLEWFLALASKYPATIFNVIGAANHESEYARIQLAEAASLSNVVVHGRISDEKLEGLYEQGLVLICTSVMEGFPTTYLEAWSYGIPVLTTFDPDKVVASNRLGLVVDDQQGLALGLGQLLDDNEGYRQTAKICREYYETHYSAEAVVPKLLSAIRSLSNH